MERYSEYFDITKYNHIIPVELICGFTAEMLSDLYVSAIGDGFAQLNIFSILLGEYYYLKKAGGGIEIAHVCSLIAMYLFSCATPAASYNLALEFAEKAVKYNDTEENRQYLAIVQGGN